MTKFTWGTVGFLGVLAGTEAADALGGQVPHTFALVAASASAVLAATIAVRNVVFVWRGPVILAFPRDEAVLCDAREASKVRSAAQLRGTLGGAGYLHPRRLALSATAWAAVSVQSLALIAPQRSVATFLPLAAAALAAGLGVLFPASPFFYREAGGGCVLAFPPDACRRLLDAEGVEPSLRPVDVSALMGSRSSGEGGAPQAMADPPVPRNDSGDPWRPV